MIILIEIDKIVDNYKQKETNYKAKELFKVYDELKLNNIFDQKKLRNKLINKYFPLKTVMINMQLMNGQVMQFIVKVDNYGFSFNEGFYLIDDDCKYYNTSSKLWCFDYHEELCFPIKRTIKINNIKKEIVESDEIELETAINPVSLNGFIKSTVIQKVLAGGELEDSMRFMKTMNILNLILSAICILMLANLMGVF